MSICRLQIGCLIILFYLAVVYLRGCAKYHKKLNESPFVWLLGLGIAVVSFDGITAFTVNNQETVNPVLNKVLHTIFLMGIDSVIFVLFLYMLYMTGMYPKKTLNKILIFIPFAINIAVVIYNIDSLEYIEGKSTNYSMGISVYTCFIMAAVYILLTIAVFVGRWKYTESNKRAGIITYLILISVVTIIQMIFPETLISSIAYTVCIIGIYMNSEDPTMKELSRYYSETVTGFATLIENRDGSTGGHVRRTAAYVGLITDKLREKSCYSKILTKDYIENLLNAAPMHDIGKISVPDSILQKPDKLTDKEFSIMKLHAENGGKIIKETFGNFGNAEYCEMAYQVARFHHEKWNGKGYPDRLSGQEIPLCARIMAVADVFDAVSQKRCYRDAMPLEKCFEIIEKGSGQDFDPVIAETFLDIRDKVEEIHSKLNS